MGGFGARSTIDAFRAIGRDARRWAACGLDLLYPPSCPVCRIETARLPGRGGDRHGGARPAAGSGENSDAGLCGRCWRELTIDAARCLRCGAPCPSAIGCAVCRRNPPVWRHIVVLSAYTGLLREAVLRAKRPAGDAVAVSLANAIVAKHRRVLEEWEIDCVAPVPMHWLRKAVRGASSADGLSRRVAALMEIPMRNALRRCRATRMQNELPAAERPRNVRDAFRSRYRMPRARVLLVDDVVTTGATLSACSRALLAAGATSVDVAVIARADRYEGEGHDPGGD